MGKMDTGISMAAGAVLALAVPVAVGSLTEGISDSIGGIVSLPEKETKTSTIIELGEIEKEAILRIASYRVGTKTLTKKEDFYPIMGYEFNEESVEVGLKGNTIISFGIEDIKAEQTGDVLTGEIVFSGPIFSTGHDPAKHNIEHPTFGCVSGENIDLAEESAHNDVAKLVNNEENRNNARTSLESNQGIFEGLIREAARKQNPELPTPSEVNISIKYSDQNISAVADSEEEAASVSK